VIQLRKAGGVLESADCIILLVQKHQSMQALKASWQQHGQHKPGTNAPSNPVHLHWKKPG
jgi:hypothetical protein